MLLSSEVKRLFKQFFYQIPAQFHMFSWHMARGAYYPARANAVRNETWVVERFGIEHGAWQTVADSDWDVAIILRYY